MEQKTRKISSHALCAKEIREELKTVFPKIKFSVKSETYSGGDSVRVHWENGPSTSQVDKIINKYQEGHFDGMSDLYEYSNLRKDIPQAKYVFSMRRISKEVVLSAAQRIAKDYGLEIPASIEDLEKSFDFNKEFYNWDQLVYKFCNGLDFTDKKSIQHIDAGKYIAI